MSKQPQIQRRVQANMSLFHFTSLAKQSRHSNQRQAIVCFQKSKQKDPEDDKWRRSNPVKLSL